MLPLEKNALFKLPGVICLYMFYSLKGTSDNTKYVPLQLAFTSLNNHKQVKFVQETRYLTKGTVVAYYLNTL